MANFTTKALSQCFSYFPFFVTRTIISLTEFLSRLDTELLKLDDKGAGFPIVFKIRSYLSRK